MKKLRKISIFVFCLCILGCSSKEEEAALQIQLDDARQRADEVKKQLDSANKEKSSLVREIEEAKNLIRYRERYLTQEAEEAEEFAQVKRYHSNLEQLTVFLEDRIKVWKRDTRKSLLGIQVRSLRLTDGRILEGAVISGITDEGVTLGGSGGGTLYPFDLLPRDFRVKIGDEAVSVENFKLKNL